MNEARYLPIDIQKFEESFNKTVKDIMPYILDRARKIGHVYLGSVDYSIVVTDSEAAYSFTLGLFAAGIFFASRAVEMVISIDNRMQEEKKKSHWQWITLNRNYLKKAQDHGLPVESLLNSDELELNSDPIFIIRRNKVAHGDIEGYKGSTGFYQTTDFTKPYKLPMAPSEDDAYDQLSKSRNFLIKWANQDRSSVASRSIT